MKLPDLTTVWSTDTEAHDTAILRNAQLKYMHAWKANPKLGYVPNDTTEVPSTTVVARAHNTPIFGKGKDDTTRYAKKARKTPLAAEHADYENNMEYLQEKHAERKGKQKAVPHNFQVGTLVCYAKEDDTLGYVFSVAGKAAWTSIYVRYLRPRPENSIAFGSAPRREVDSQPISPSGSKQAGSQTDTHSLGFLSVAQAAPSSREAHHLRASSGPVVMQPASVVWVGGSNPSRANLAPPPA